MSAPGALLCVCLADDAAPATATEFVRLGAAALAAGSALVFLDLSARGLRAQRMVGDALRHLELVAAAAPSAPPTPAALRTALRASASLLCLSSPSRPATPALLVVTDRWLDAVSDADLVPALRQAGQVVRASL